MLAECPPKGEVGAVTHAAPRDDVRGRTARYSPMVGVYGLRVEEQSAAESSRIDREAHRSGRGVE